MTTNSNKLIALRRILVAIDTSAHSRAALEAAAALANIMEADIRGLFVQEEHWSHVSRLSSTQAINVLTGKTQTLEEDSLQRQINSLERRLRRELQFISKRHEISHSWETKQGRVAEKILEAAEDADLITIGRRGRSLFQHKKLGSTARKVIKEAQKPTLVLQKGLGLQSRQTITVLYDASEVSQQCLQTALSIAQKNEGELTVLVPDKYKRDSNAHTESLENIVNTAGIPVQVIMLPRPSIGGFIHAVKRQHTGLLVMARDHYLLENGNLDTTLDYLNCPLLMI